MAATVYSPGRHGSRRDSDSALAAAEGSPGRRASRFTQSLGLGPNGQASQPDSVTVTVTVKVIAAAAVCDRDPPGRRRASNMIRGIEPESRVPGPQAQAGRSPTPAAGTRTTRTD